MTTVGLIAFGAGVGVGAVLVFLFRDLFRAPAPEPRFVPTEHEVVRWLLDHNWKETADAIVVSARLRAGADRVTLCPVCGGDHFYSEHSAAVQNGHGRKVEVEFTSADQQVTDHPFEHRGAPGYDFCWHEHVQVPSPIRPVYCGQKRAAHTMVVVHWSDVPETFCHREPGDMSADKRGPVNCRRCLAWSPGQ